MTTYNATQILVDLGLTEHQIAALRDCLRRIAPKYPPAGKGTCTIHGPWVASKKCPTCGANSDVQPDTPEWLYHLERFAPSDAPRYTPDTTDEEPTRT